MKCNERENLGTSDPGADRCLPSISFPLLCPGLCFPFFSKKQGKVGFLKSRSTLQTLVVPGPDLISQDRGGHRLTLHVEETLTRSHPFKGVS